MNISSIASNLKRIRAIKGFKQEELANQAGLSRVAYSSIENAKSEPRVSNLQKLADVLGVSIVELIKPVPQLASLRFRKNNMTKRERDKRDQIVIDVAYWLKDFNFLESELQYEKVFKLKKCKGKSPEEIAQNARELLGLKKDEPINDICGLVENAGIKIQLIVSELDKFFGLSAFGPKGCPAVIVNVSDNITVERQIFTVAHELGHILLHKNSYNPDEIREPSVEEKEADEFAGYFLMPRDAFIKSWKENEGLHWFDNILHIKRIYKVSYQTVLRRLKGLGAPDLYKDFYRIHKTKYGRDLKNHKEPIPLDKIDFLEDRLSKLVRDAYEKEMISFSRAAEVLRINNDEMRERVNSWEELNELV
ncbi:MAG: ImmA/IrrE family metallo-endopeptidase [Candidatus Omnitrophica bacterium]|nr:ImmA/IrrE family metallo-endopeptidase [Candidatus Omnitrophota bacterium]